MNSGDLEMPTLLGQRPSLWFRVGDRAFISVRQPSPLVFRPLFSQNSVETLADIPEISKWFPIESWIGSLMQ